VLARIGSVAYQLALPSHIRVHNVFHVSILKKYVYDPRHVIRWQDIQVGIVMTKRLVEVIVSRLFFLKKKETNLNITCCRSNWKERSWSNR